MTNKLQEIVRNLEKLAAVEVRSQDIREVMATLIPQLATTEDARTLDHQEIETLKNIATVGNQLIQISKKSQRLDPKLEIMLDTLGKALQGL